MLYNAISIYFLIMVIAVVYWAAHIHSVNGSSYARTIILLCFAVCCYILGYVLELNSSSAAQILFWNMVEYLGIPFVSALWLTVGLMYTGHFFQFRKFWLAAIYIIPSVTMLLRFTNQFHHLYFASVSFLPEAGRTVLVKTPGIWMYIQLGHSMLMICLTLALLVRDSLKSRERDTGKIVLMAAASFFAVLGLVLLLVRPFGLHLDYMALCLPIPCVMVILAILRYDFLETKSMARSKAFEFSRDAILLINPQNKVIDYNKSAKQLMATVNIRLSDGYLGALFQSAPRLLAHISASENSILRLDVGSEKRFYEISTKGIDSRNASHGWIKTIRDVTQLYKLNESLKQQAMMDELSGLHNRRAFMQAGRSLLTAADTPDSQVYLMMMDLDHFKRVNDQYGHQMGDRVIQSIGETLKEHIVGGNLVARLGGEEFAALLTGLDGAEVRQKAEAVLQSVARHEHGQPGRTFHITISIGIAKRRAPSQTLDRLMHIADEALYQSKDSGRNSVTVL